MRKEYVKPLMESEEFVSNEYVAACWDLRCDTPFCEYNRYLNRIGGDSYGEDELLECVKDYEKEYSNIIHQGGDKTYEDTGKYYHSGGLGHHELTITPVPKTDKHPNASV